VSLSKLCLRRLKLCIEALDDLFVLDFRNLNLLNILVQLGVQVSLLLLQLLGQALILRQLLLKLLALVFELLELCMLLGNEFNLVDKARDDVELGSHPLPCHFFAESLNQLLVLSLEQCNLALEAQQGFLACLLHFLQLEPQLLYLLLLHHHNLLVLALVRGHCLAHLTFLVLNERLVLEL